MEARDKSHGFDFEAIYDEIVFGNSFTYTMGDGRMVHVSFKTLNDKIEVTILFDAEEENSIELHDQYCHLVIQSPPHLPCHSYLHSPFLPQPPLDSPRIFTYINQKRSKVQRSGFQG